MVSITPTGGVNFPNTVQGQTATAIVQTITNTGNATLNLSSITIVGANHGDFLLSQNTCLATLAANANCQVSITFTPSATGARTANLAVADNASGSPQLVALTGTGTPPNAPVVTFTPSGTIGFPSTAQGATSAAMTVTIGNTGGALLNISGIALGGANAGDFAIASNNCGATLAANGSCMVSLTFKPTATGVRLGALVVTDNAAGSPQSAVLSGTGTAAGAPVTITPSPVPAFTATQGTSSNPTTVTITNTGSALVTFATTNPISIAGANSGDFSIAANSNTCGATLAIGASCTVGVVFSPAGSGNRSATLQVNDNATGSPQTAALSGTAAAAFTLTSGSSAQSATVTAGQAATYNLQITPGSGFTGSVMWACTGAPSGAACTVTPNPVPLTGATAASFTVSVTTTARSMLMPPMDRRPMPPTSPLVLLERLIACLALLVLIYELRRRGGLTSRQLAYCGGALLLAVTLYGLSGCGGGSSGGGGGGGGTTGTQAGTYTLTLTPTATGPNGKALTLSPVSLTLIVN